MNVATQPHPVEATYVDLATDTGGVNLPAVQDPHQHPATPSGTVPMRQDAPVHYPPKMAKAILAVMRGVGPVAKADKNTFHNYFYQSWENILIKLSPLLADNGLIISQSQISQSLFDNDTLLAITYEFTLINEDGDVWPVRPRWSAFSRLKDSKGMYDDKAANKCHTQASKYFLLHLFKIRTRDDSDADGGGQKKTAPSAAATIGRKVEPGVDPATGEVGPYAISTTSTTIRAWADIYIAAIKTSRTIDELEQWAAVNDEAMGEITTKGSEVVNKQLDEAYEALKVGFLQADKAKEAKPAEQPARRGPPSAKAAAARPAASPDWRRDMIGALSGFTESDEVDAFVLGLKDQKSKVSEQDWDAVQVEIEQARRRIALEN